MMRRLTSVLRRILELRPGFYLISTGAEERAWRATTSFQHVHDIEVHTQVPGITPAAGTKAQFRSIFSEI